MKLNHRETTKLLKKQKKQLVLQVEEQLQANG